MATQIVSLDHETTAPEQKIKVIQKIERRPETPIVPWHKTHNIFDKNKRCQVLFYNFNVILWITWYSNTMNPEVEK
jgi:hypothetical protein